MGTKAKAGVVLTFGGLALSLLAARFVHLGPPRQTYTHLSPTFLIHQVIPSMQGPVSNDNDIALAEGNPELVWIRGYEAHMVAPDGKNMASQEYMCHNTLSIHRGLEQHRQLFGAEPYGTRRLFTLSYGQYDIEFPQGFGIPVATSEKLMLQSKVLNLNESGIGAEVRHKVDVHFIRDRDLTSPLKPLCLISACISVPRNDPIAVKPTPTVFDPEYGPPKKLEKCEDEGDDASGFIDGDSWGGLKVRGRPGFPMWTVHPGQVDMRRTRLAQLFPFDTTVHYISVHAHPALETLEIRDATTDTNIFTAVGEQAPTGVGLTSVSHFSSQGGVPIYKDHKYELISTYHNKTEKDIEAMAFAWFYIQDQNFHKPDERTIRKSDESLCGPPLVKQ